MSYMALYRKWRPDEFEEVKGQEHVVTTLKNQITHDRIGHAYLFCGTRGTGKTTVAKLFAKAVNCEHPLEDGSPCNECATCKAIQAGNSLNVIEIDAASNNGVDNIRDIREEVQYSPAEGKYKVYIIDEVHMLSIGAFNALLKTLEEPPSYVIFILATTEAHKIPITILSRCQRYDFRRISIETIYERLMELLRREGIEAEEKAVRYVAKAADGSMRDALSLLDQCIAFYLGQKLTYDKVLEVLGAVDIDVFNRLITEIVKGQTMEALSIIDEIIWQGRELSQFVTDFTWYMRNLMMVKISDDVNDQLDLSAENLAIMKKTAGEIELATLMRYIRVFSELSNQIRYATQKRVSLELAIIKLTTPQMEVDTDSILDRLRVLERKVDKGTLSLTEEQIAVISAKNTASDVPQETTDINREAILKRELTPARIEDLKMIKDSLEKIGKDQELRNRIGETTARFLEAAKIQNGHDNQSILLSFDNTPAGTMGYRQFSKEEHIDTLKDIVGELTGKQVEISVVMADTAKETDASNINLAKVNFDVIVED